MSCSERVLPDAARADVPPRTRGVTHHELIVRDTFRYDRTRANHAPPAEGYAAANGRIGADRGPFVDSGFCDFPVVSRDELLICAHRPRMQIIRKTHVRADEHAVSDEHTLIDGNVILNLDAIANLDVRVHEHTAG